MKGGSGAMSDERGFPDLSGDSMEHISLCEALDRVLSKGAVVVGELTISVANIDLIYLALQLILTSIETAQKAASIPVGEGHRASAIMI